MRTLKTCAVVCSFAASSLLLVEANGIASITTPSTTFSPTIKNPSSAFERTCRLPLENLDIAKNSNNAGEAWESCGEPNSAIKEACQVACDCRKSVPTTNAGDTKAICIGKQTKDFSCAREGGFNCSSFPKATSNKTSSRSVGSNDSSVFVGDSINGSNSNSGREDVGKNEQKKYGSAEKETGYSSANTGDSNEEEGIRPWLVAVIIVSCISVVSLGYFFCSLTPTNGDNADTIERTLANTWKEESFNGSLHDGTAQSIASRGETTTASLISASPPSSYHLDPQIEQPNGYHQGAGAEQEELEDIVDMDEFDRTSSEYHLDGTQRGSPMFSPMSDATSSFCIEIDDRFSGDSMGSLTDSAFGSREVFL